MHIRKWAVAALLIAAGLAVLMGVSWCAGLESSWVGAYVTALSVSVALAAALMQLHARDKLVRLEKSVEAIGSMALYKDPFDRLKDEWMPKTVPDDTALSANMIDQYKLGWERSTWGAELLVAPFLNQKQTNAVLTVRITGKSTRKEMAEVARTLREDDKSSYAADRERLINAAEAHLESIDAATAALGNL